MIAKQKNLSTDEIVRLLDVANENRTHRGTTKGELPTVAERQKARRKLLSEYRLQRQLTDAEQIARVDPMLFQAVEDWGLRIFSDPNPVQALEYFLGTRQRPGRRAKNTDRDCGLRSMLSKK